ncbi:hypothetical protein MAIT1_03568 [Magnetofaba australis IT-1]|uniref:Uncharacterized protein n=1 Tax=Magnetofaba australis IT-1 TaxID=1434232 RepID=A0A1Y2K7P4_9PROT|nr:hypothetical protein MAIT1_03568 [Magnetofaba australis IT-1]
MAQRREVGIAAHVDGLVGASLHAGVALPAHVGLEVVSATVGGVDVHDVRRTNIDTVTTPVTARHINKCRHILIPPSRFLEVTGRFALDPLTHVTRVVAHVLGDVGELLLQLGIGQITHLGQVLTGAVSLGHALLESGGGLEEHVRELGPAHAGEQRGGGEDEQNEEEPVQRAGAHGEGPQQSEGGGAQQGDDEHVSRDELVPAAAFGADVNAQAEEEPVAAHADAGGAQVPQTGDDGRGVGARGGVLEDQQRGGDDEADKAVHLEDVGDAAVGILEFGGGEHIHGNGLHGDGDLLSGADVANTLFLSFFSVREEIFGALLVDHVQNSAANDQDEHHDNITLHNFRGYERREFGKGITANHGCCPPGVDLATIRLIIRGRYPAAKKN